MKRFMILTALLLAALASAQSAPLAPGGSHAIVHLGNDEASETHHLVVPANLDSLFITLTFSEGVQASLEAPDGNDVPPTETESGATQWFVASPAAGTWTVTLAHDQAQERMAFVEAFYNGAQATRLSVLMPYTNIAGESITVSVALLEGIAPVTEADVDIQIISGNGDDHGTFQARDSGNASDGDADAGDGLYSVLLSSVPAGFHGARATVHLPDGSRLTTVQFFEVHNRTARLDGSWSDTGEDTNADALIDTISLEFGVDVDRAGDYAVEALLLASNGNEAWSRNGSASLTTGSSAIRTELTTQDLKERLGVSGPYHVTAARLLWTPRDMSVTPRSHIASELTDLGSTHAYDLGDLDRPYLLFTGFLGDEGVDTNGNGQFDVIRVQFEIDSVIEGQHDFAWNARLVPEAGLPADGRPSFASGQAPISAGSNTLTLEFPVEEYGVNGVSGVFLITDPSLYPTQALPSPYNQASADRFQSLPQVLGTTRPYSLGEIEGGLPSTIAALIEYVRAMPIDHSAESSNALRQQLISSLEQAEEADNNGQSPEAANQLRAFLNAINAQAGKAILEQDAEVCHEAVQTILDTL